VRERERECVYVSFLLVTCKRLCVCVCVCVCVSVRVSECGVEGGGREIAHTRRRASVSGV
jgi:hypothetical protein